MEKPLTMALLTVAGFAAGMAVLAAVFPGVLRLGNAIAADRSSQTSQSSLHTRIPNAFSELDGSAVWQDTDSDTYFDAWLWVKNTGETTITDIAELDLFVHQGGVSQRIPHSTDAGATYPQWTGAVEGGGSWLAGSTLKINVHYSAAISPGDYVLRVVTPYSGDATGTFTF